jgi:blue light- and temperature-responsive anti-repressor
VTDAAADEVDDRDFSFAFQPIIDTRRRTVFSHEALVRGLNNEGAFQVINRYSAAQAAAFDAACRAKAISVAVALGLRTHLNLNFLPTAAADAELGLNSTIEAARRLAFPLQRIIVEATEGAVIHDHAIFARIVNEYRRVGIGLAIDDFGAGYSGLNLLAEFQPDIVKIDMGLVRGIESHGPRQAIVRAIIQLCLDLGIDVVAEGVETVEEFSWFSNHGVSFFQGYLFAKPSFEAFPAFHIPDVISSGIFPGALAR